MIGNTFGVILFALGAVVARVVAADTEAGPDAEMVITAARVERQVFETPQAVTLITDREVDESNAMATPDLFRYATGVFMQKTNLGGGSPFIRGLTGKQVLILVDGIRLNNSYYRFGPHQYLNTLDTELIERIEVIRGPMSVLYGSDALGGTINIITRRPDDTLRDGALGGLLHASYDSAVDGGRLRTQAEGRLGEVALSAGVTAKQLQDLQGGGDIGTQTPSGYDEWDGDLKLVWPLAPGQDVTLGLQHTDQQDVPKTSEVTLGSKLKFDYEPQQRTLAYATYRGKDLGGFETVKIDLSWHRQQEGERIVERATSTQESREVTDVATAGVAVQLSDRLNARHGLTYGFEYYRDVYDTRKERVDLTGGAATMLDPGAPDGAHYESLGIYLQDEVRLHRRVTVTAGLRWSQIETAGQLAGRVLNLAVDQLTGSANGVLRISRRLNLVAGVAQGFRAPNMEDFFGRVDFYSELPNTGLTPEESLNREIGLKYYTRATAADLYYYQSDYEGLIDRVTVGTQPNGDPIKQRRNVRDARIRGIEASASHRFDHQWSLGGALLWTRGEDRDNAVPLQRIPPVNGNVRLRYEFSPRLWNQLSLTFARRQHRLSPGDLNDPRIPPGGTPGFAALHWNGGWQPSRRQQWLLSLENVGDKAYKTHGSGLFAPGRSVTLSYRLKLD